MRIFLKSILPKYIIDLLNKFISEIDRYISQPFRINGFLSSLFYFILNSKFNREHKSVLSGKYEYYQRLKILKKSSFLLRRNIHRIEKGMIMKDRKEVFAEDYIEETVNILKKALTILDFSKTELKWSIDVLDEYFKIVKETKKIKKAKDNYGKLKIRINNNSKYIPYEYRYLKDSKISYEDLKLLFIKRRSVRIYRNKTVAFDIFKKAINLASLAPSSCNRQSFYFYFSNKKKKSIEIAECAGGTPGWSESINSIIVIVGDLSAYPNERDRHLIYIDGSLSAMQLMLAFETLGCSTCAINWPDIEHREIRLKKILKLKEYERPIMMISVGYADENGKIPYSMKKKPEELIRNI